MKIYHYLLEGSLQLRNLDDRRYKKSNFEKEYPREGCGVIGIVKGKKRFFPCENVAEGEEDFHSSVDYFNLKQSVDIYAIVRNHPNATNDASEHIQYNYNAVGIPYYIFSYPEMDLNILDPNKN